MADGLNIYYEQCYDSVFQNIFHNGWSHDHYVGNIFSFAPSGVIITCAYYAPGSFHDSPIADCGKVYSKLEKFIELNCGCCIVDYSFSTGDYPFLTKSANDHLLEGKYFRKVVKFLQATSSKQASQWGMRAFHGSPPCMKVHDRFIYEERGERNILILTTILFLALGKE